MCNYQKLFCSEIGYVIKCARCNRYQVSFLTTALNLSHEHFRYLIEIVQERIAKCDNAEFPVKNVYIPSPANGFGLILTYKEALKLLEMLDYARNEAIALQMIQLFAE